MALLMNKVLLPCLLLVVSVLYVPTSEAHYLDLAQFSLFQQAEDNRFTLVAALPENLDPGQPLSWPRGCEATPVDPAASSVAGDLAFDVRCEAGSSGHIQTRWGKDGAIVDLHLADGSSSSSMLPGGPVGAAIQLPDWQSTAPAGFWATAWRYLELGTVHVLVGWDHLAFVFCLSLLATGGSLLWLITAFTAGHSVSLALAHFGLLKLPIAPVEAIIALSVVFMAREAILAFRQSKPDDARSSLRWRVSLTAAFGLIHGLGFASVLGSLGVSPTETVTALAFFNIGVEFGQVLFVFGVLACLRLFRMVRLEMPLMRAATYCVGGMGMVWTLERVMGV